MLYSIDRIEGGTAVLADDHGQTRREPLVALPPGVAEGDMLRRTPQGYRADPEETARRRAKARSLLDGLLGKKGGG